MVCWTKCVIAWSTWNSKTGDCIYHADSYIHVHYKCKDYRFDAKVS